MVYVEAHGDGNVFINCIALTLHGEESFIVITMIIVYDLLLMSASLVSDWSEGVEANYRTI